MRRPILLLSLLAGCEARELPEDWTTWYDPGDGYDVAEPVSFTDTPYDFFPPSSAEVSKIAEVRGVMTSTFSNAGPLFAQDDWHPDDAACDFWAPAPAGSLPRTVQGIVTSHPRVYRKIEGCNGDERYYGSYWLEDDTGGVFVLNDSKVAHFEMGAHITLEVRAVRRRFDLDMVYVSQVVDVAPEPVPIAYAVATAPLRRADQSKVFRVSGVVVEEPSTFGEILLQPDGWEGTCSGDTNVTRDNCQVVLLDVELNRRGIAFAKGDHVQVTGPVGQTAFFAPNGVFNYYGPYVTRIGQIERLD